VAAYAGRRLAERAVGLVAGNSAPSGWRGRAILRAHRLLLQRRGPGFADDGARVWRSPCRVRFLGMARSRSRSIVRSRDGHAQSVFEPRSSERSNAIEEIRGHVQPSTFGKVKHTRRNDGAGTPSKPPQPSDRHRVVAPPHDFLDRRAVTHGLTDNMERSRACCPSARHEHVARIFWFTGASDPSGGGRLTARSSHQAPEARRRRQGVESKHSKKVLQNRGTQYGKRA